MLRVLDRGSRRQHEMAHTFNSFYDSDEKTFSAGISETVDAVCHFTWLWFFIVPPEDCIV